MEKIPLSFDYFQKNKTYLYFLEIKPIHLISIYKSLLYMYCGNRGLFIWTTFDEYMISFPINYLRIQKLDIQLSNDTCSFYFFSFYIF